MQFLKFNALALIADYVDSETLKIFKVYFLSHCYLINRTESSFPKVLLKETRFNMLREQITYELHFQFSVYPQL